MRVKLKRQSVLDEGDCSNPKQPGPQGAAILLLLSFVTSSIFSPLFSLTEHSGPSATFQANNLKKGVGAAATISGNGNIDASATYKNANVASISGNLHDPSSFGNFTVNDQFQQQVNQNAALEKADANLEAGKAKLEQGRNAIAASGNDYQREVLRNENTSAQDKHDVLVTIGKSNELAMDPSSASTWLGRATQDVVGSFLGSTGLGASDSNGFIDKNGKYVQRNCFVAGTLIQTKEGLKPIEKIEIGDLVLSLDPKTGEMSYKRVSRLFSKETPLIHRVTYTNGNVINTTWNHPFFIRGKGFTEVRNIRPEERSVTVASIRNSSRIERRSGIQIGASLAALGSQSPNSNSATWKDEVRGTVGIAKIEQVYEKTKVYNFEVEDNHTYFVGKDGVLVHNDAGCMAGGFATGVGKSIARLVDAPQHLIETGASIAAPDNFRVTDEFGRPVDAHPLEAPLSKGVASTLYDKLVTEPGAEKAANSACPDCSKDYSTGYKWGNFIGDGMLLVAGGLTALRGKLGGLGGKASAAEEGAVVRKAGAAANGESQASQFIFDSNLGKNGGYRDAITGKIVESNTFGKSLGEYSAIKPGPLQDKLAETFAGGRYREIKLQNDTILYRAGTAETPFGQFYSLEPPKGILQTRIDKAVKPVWSNGATSPIDSVITIRIPAGTKIYAGKVGTQGGFYVGGTQQIVIPDAWAVKGAKVLNISPLK